MVIGIIIAIIALFIFLTGMSGVGIKSLLIKEIHVQCHNRTGSKYYQSISFEEAYQRLSPFDANNIHNGVPDYHSYYFWALVDGIPCFISVDKEPFKKGIRLLVTREDDFKEIMRSLPDSQDKVNIPTNLKSI
ncbi:TPA: hypothetical protein ACFP4C_001339 [Neisseria subflava]